MDPDFDPNLDYGEGKTWREEAIARDNALGCAIVICGVELFVLILVAAYFIWLH